MKCVMHINPHELRITPLDPQPNIIFQFPPSGASPPTPSPSNPGRPATPPRSRGQTSPTLNPPPNRYPRPRNMPQPLPTIRNWPTTPSTPLSPTAPYSPSAPWNNAWGNNYDSTEYVRFIDGKLQEKGKKFPLDYRYNEYWYVVKGKAVNGVLHSVKLFKFKDSNTHLQEHFIESCDLKLDGQLSVKNIIQEPKNHKFQFDVFNDKSKMTFRTHDKTIMYRWIYVFHDLVAKRKVPDDLPNLLNNKIPSCVFLIVNDKNELIERYENFPPRHPRMLPDVPRRVSPKPPFRQGSLDKADSETKGFKVALQHRVKFYHRGMKRQEAEKLLTTRPPGTYLLRDCSHNERYFVLSYRNYDSVTNLEIIYTAKGMYSFNEQNEYVTKEFPSPEIGVNQFFEQKHRSNFQGFRPCPLEHILRRSSVPETNTRNTKSDGHKYTEINDLKSKTLKRSDSSNTDISQIHFHLDRKQPLNNEDPKTKHGYVNLEQLKNSEQNMSRKYINMPTSENKPRRSQQKGAESNNPKPEPHYVNGDVHTDTDSNGYTPMGNPYTPMGFNKTNIINNTNNNNNNNINIKNNNIKRGSIRSTDSFDDQEQGATEHDEGDHYVIIT